MNYFRTITKSDDAESSLAKYKKLKSKPLEERKEEIRKIRIDYPDRIPILVYRNKHNKDIGDLDKIKYLV